MGEVFLYTFNPKLGQTFADELIFFAVLASYECHCRILPD